MPMCARLCRISYFRRGLYVMVPGRVRASQTAAQFGYTNGTLSNNAGATKPITPVHEA